MTSFPFDSEDQKTTEAELTGLAAVVRAAIDMESDIAAAEAELDRMKKALFRIKTVDIPEAAKEFGITFAKIVIGESTYTIEIRNDVKTNISEKNRRAVFDWLINWGFGDLIKTTVVTEFGPGNHEEAVELAAQLENAQLKEVIHPQTLKSFVKERLAANQPLPLELFGVFQYQTTIIKEK